jgi:hypothetical protein
MRSDRGGEWGRVKATLQQTRVMGDEKMIEGQCMWVYLVKELLRRYGLLELRFHHLASIIRTRHISVLTHFSATQLAHQINQIAPL